MISKEERWIGHSGNAYRNKSDATMSFLQELMGTYTRSCYTYYLDKEKIQKNRRKIREYLNDL